MIPASSAGAYTVTGLMEDPGGRTACVARLVPRFMIFSPLPPTSPNTSPVYGSMMTMADSGCKPEPLDGMYSLSFL